MKKKLKKYDFLKKCTFWYPPINLSRKAQKKPFRSKIFMDSDSPTQNLQFCNKTQKMVRYGFFCLSTGTGSLRHVTVPNYRNFPTPVMSDFVRSGKLSNLGPQVRSPRVIFENLKKIFIRPPIFDLLDFLPFFIFLEKLFSVR